jgi:excisionase family DNA binding protein
MSPERRPPDVDDEFLTVAEVAAVLKLNQQTIRNWIDAGSLAALRVGRRVRVLRRDLDQLLADAAQPSRVEQRTATDEPGTDDGWRDAQQFAASHDGRRRFRRSGPGHFPQRARRSKRGPLRPRQQPVNRPSTACGLSDLRLRNILADRTSQLPTKTTTHPT